MAAPVTPTEVPASGTPSNFSDARTAANESLNQPAPVETPAPEAEATETKPETFDREYVEKLRAENAERRTAVKEYEDAFSAYSPQEKAALLEITKGLADPNTSAATARRLREIADGILKGADDGTPTRPTGEVDPDQKPLTKAEWERLQGERDTKAQELAMVASIESEARALEIEPGTVEYAELLFFAQDPEVGGDLTKANEKLQAHYDAKAAAKAAKVEASGARWPAAAGTAPNSGAADAEGGPPKDFKSARKAALAFLGAKAGATS